MAELDLQVIKQRIALARKTSGYTQEEMAKLLGISQPAYSSYESGDKPLPLRQIKTIAQLLNQPAQYFLGDLAGDMEKEQHLQNISKQLETLNETMLKILGVLERLPEKA